MRPCVRCGHVAEREEDERSAGDRQDKQSGNQPDDDLTGPRAFACGGEGHAEAAVPDQPLASPEIRVQRVGVWAARLISHMHASSAAVRLLARRRLNPAYRGCTRPRPED